MADYASDIVPVDYLYKRAIMITEKTGSDQVDVILRLDLTSSNFNFDFARSDGLDFRLAEGGSGTFVLNMFVGYWDTTLEKATLYFKLPSFDAGSVKTVYAFFGNSTDTGISDIHSLGFYLSDHFDDNTIYNNNWSQGGTVTVTKYFGGDSQGNTTIKLINGNNVTGYIQSKTDPIPILSSWAAEMGFWMYEDTTINDTWKYSHFISFWGTGLDEIRNYFAADGNGGGFITDDEEYGVFSPRTENFEDGASTYPNNYWGHMWGALVLDSYHQNFFGYHLPTDNFYYGMYNRNVNRISSSCPSTWNDNYVENKERKIENDSDFTRVRIYGARRGGFDEWKGTEVYFDWVIVRKFFGPNEPEWNLSGLYTDIENVPPDVLEFEYGPDQTHINYEHTTTSGGDPTKLSNNSYGSLDDVWCSDDSAATSSGVDIIIDYSTYSGDLTGLEHLHYGDGTHITFLNASKLSDNDTDRAGNTYWNATTTSGWSAIDFTADAFPVSVLMVKGVSSKLGGMPKNYRIEGSFLHPLDDEWVILKENQFDQTACWQSVVFDNTVRYRYYRLYVIDTYGDNIALQEWRMYEYNVNTGKKIISRLRLKPTAFDSIYIYFPKQIAFYGSNDLHNWTTLIATRNTYTPHGVAWQEYTFTNDTYFYHYKLKVVGNWNENVDKICIAEWEMQEKTSEAYTYRITAGTHNDFGSIWARSDSTFDDLDLYLVNDVISHIENVNLVAAETFTGSPTDLNVK